MTKYTSFIENMLHYPHMWNWDYDLHRDWQPKTDAEWEWYLVRRINYGEFEGLRKTIVKKYFPRIKNYLDPGKRAMLEYFFTHGISHH